MKKKEFEMRISPELYEILMEKKSCVTQESISSLFYQDDKLRESVNNWLCKTANEQNISLFVLCNMFDIDVKHDYEYDDNHSLNVVYNFVLVPKENYIEMIATQVPHF